MCKYVSTAPLDCIGAFTCPSIGVHEQTICHTCSEARRPGRKECGQSVNNTEIGFTRESCRKCFPPELEPQEDESGVGSSHGDGTVSGSAISKGTVAVSGNYASNDSTVNTGPHTVSGSVTGNLGGNIASNDNAVNKAPRTVSGSFTGNFHGHVGNGVTPTVNGSAPGAIYGNNNATSTGKAPTVPSMAWIKERGQELMKVKEAAMARVTMKPGPVERSGTKGGMAREAVMTMGPVKPGPVERPGNKGAMAREAVMTMGTVKPGWIEGSVNKNAMARAVTQGTVKPSPVEEPGNKDNAMSVAHH